MFKNMLKVVLVSTTGIANILPDTLFLNQYRKLRARYGFDRKEIPITEDINRKCKEVMDDLNLSELERQRIQFFNAHDINPFHAGSVTSKHGAIIGIPVNFQYQDIHDINEKSIVFQNAIIDWDTVDGKRFQNSLVLSENAQKFVLAHEILSTKMCSVPLKGLATSFDIFLGFGIYELLKFKLQKQPKMHRLFGLFIIAIGTAIAWVFTKDAFNSFIEGAVNEKISQFGHIYVQGGLEYYKKLSERNKALRNLLGDTGKKLFTHSGNEYSLFRQKKIPISQQIDYFNSIQY